MNTSFESFIEELKASVALMTEEMQRQSHEHDFIWPDVLRCFAYVKNLSSEDFRTIRLHTGLITGEFVYQYWHTYPPLDPERYAAESGYLQLTAGLPQDNWLGEPSNPDLPVNVGVQYRDWVLNKNTVRYQSCLSNLYHLGVLPRLRAQERPLVLEIGGGYGALAHHVHAALPQSTYVLVDLAPMLLFSGAYLKQHNPEARIFLYNPSKPEDFAQACATGFRDYDFVLLPAHLLDRPAEQDWPDLDLAINMMSFQEMPEQVLEQYLHFVAEHLSEQGLIYSNNIDRHPCNLDHGLNVTRQLAQVFELFPKPEAYLDPELNADHPWYYRFYAGHPKDRAYAWPENTSIMARAYVPQDQLNASGFFEPKWIHFKQQ